MSEADSPNDQSGSPAPSEPVELSAALDSATAERSNLENGEDWQTINFPGAMSVDAIPTSLVEPVEQRLATGLSVLAASGVIHYSSAEIDHTTPSFAIAAATSDDAMSRQRLEDENAALRDRLAQVELDLVQQQIEWQLESARTQAQSEATEAVSTAASADAIAQPSTFEPMNERLSQLSQELERSHQTVQQQQILVETLTEQLESSQERIAQLERDCALTQERHNEQVQQVLQAECACRDLRLRLHRQQQQTLQFKAALEKCLEMPAAYGQQMMPDRIDDSAATPDALVTLLKPKNQPVKPWSVPQRESHEPERDEPELPKPLFKLLNGLSSQDQESSGLQGSTLPAPADPSALLDSDDPEFVTQLMQLIFPNTAEQQAYATADALQAEPIFDLSPFVDAGDVPAEAILPVESSQGEPVSPKRSTAWTTVSPEAIEAAAQQSDAVSSNASVIANLSTPVEPDDRSADPLWDNLAALIDYPDTVEGTEVTSAVGLVRLGTTIDPNNAIDPNNSSDSTVQPIATWTWRDRLEKATKTPRSAVPENALFEKAAQSPAKLLALGSANRAIANQQPSTSQQTVNVSSQTQPMPTPVSTVAPSPIVYPLHYTKKLASLAAVDLPTFPRR